MDISSIEVSGLFGTFRHTVRLRKKNRVTIIYGQNGVGKTTLLRMLKYLFSFQFANLAKNDFQSFIIRFDNGVVLTVIKEQSVQVSPTARPRLFFHRSTEGNPENSQVIHEFVSLDSESLGDKEIQSLLGLRVGMIEDIVPELDQIGPRSWRVIPSGEIIGLDEVVERYTGRLPINPEALERKLTPQELVRVLGATKISLIETQRLFAKNSSNLSKSMVAEGRRYREPVVHLEATAEGSAVAELSRDLASQIANALLHSGQIATKLDAQFAHQLITGSGISKELNESEIRELYKQYKEYNQSLARAGILEHQYIHDLPTTVLQSGDRKALTLYLRDVHQKLEPFSHLLEKVSLFTTLINDRFRHKSVEVNKDRGLRFKNYNGKDIPGSGLSSGEQHELVLMYTLLFKIDPGSLILIDEPELSLHVTWQQRFLEDLDRLSKISNIDFLVATHSPSIINGRLDLATELEG